jgi:DNA-binding response OmpR family regulator
MDSAIRILIIENEPAFAGYIRDYLGQSGMTAEVHHNGADAVELVLPTSPHLVILDVMLPGKDGLTICREKQRINERDERDT